MRSPSYRIFAGLLVGAALARENIFATETHWRRFLRQHGWKEFRQPLQTSGFVRDEFLASGRARLSLALAHGNQVGHILLAFQGLFARRQMAVGILCVHTAETFSRVQTDLAWLRPVLTVPIWLVAVK